jgi:hypothetical protein
LRGGLRCCRFTHTDLEILLIIGMCVLMVRIANYDDESGFLWGGIALVLCLVSLVIPIPIFRILIAGVAAFVAYFVYKLVSHRR